MKTKSFIKDTKSCSIWLALPPCPLFSAQIIQDASPPTVAFGSAAGAGGSSFSILTRTCGRSGTSSCRWPGSLYRSIYITNCSFNPLLRETYISTYEYFLHPIWLLYPYIRLALLKIRTWRGPMLIEENFTCIWPASKEHWIGSASLARLLWPPDKGQCILSPGQRIYSDIPLLTIVVCHMYIWLQAPQAWV